MRGAARVALCAAAACADADRFGANGNFSVAVERSQRKVGDEVRMRDTNSTSNTTGAGCGLATLSRSPPAALLACYFDPLPGGYRPGDAVYYTGGSHTFPSGNRLVHGGAVEVTGPATAESHKGEGVKVRFPGNSGGIDCYLKQLSRSPPDPLPGGYQPGDAVYFTGDSRTFPNGNWLVHGVAGEVTGPATYESIKGKGVEVRFPGNAGANDYFLASLSRSPVLLPGGYRPGDAVYLTGGSHTFPDGDRLVRGGAGEVTGPATVEWMKGKGVSVRFPGNTLPINCFLTSLRTPSVGDHVTVTTGFMSNSKDAVFLRAGLQGTVQRVDEDGNAYIKFAVGDDGYLPQCTSVGGDGYLLQWVFKKQTSSGRTFGHITFAPAGGGAQDVVILTPDVVILYERDNSTWSTSSSGGFSRERAQVI